MKMQEGMIPVPGDIDVDAVKRHLAGRGRGPFRLAGQFHFRQIREGEVIDEWDADNIVTDEGLDDVLDVYLSGGTQITSWYVLLKDNTGDPLDGAETYATPVFSEIATYSEGTRPAWTDGGVSSQSVDNSGSAASFSINGTTTVDSAGLVGGGTAASTKEDTAGGGKLFCCANFASEKSLSSGDTLEVTYTVTSADDGS